MHVDINIGLLHHHPRRELLPSQLKAASLSERHSSASLVPLSQEHHNTLPAPVIVSGPPSLAMAVELFYTPTSCGAASYIAAKKAGLLGKSISAYVTDIKGHKVLSGPKKGEDFYAVNYKGNVPALVLEDKTLLNEGSAVLQWIADQAPESGLAPANGTSARYLLQAKLNYVASEIHASCGPLFNPTLPPEARAAALDRLKTKLTFLSTKELTEGKKYLVGDAFTVADSYLYICLSWLGYIGTSLDEFPVLKAYSENIGSLDFVKEAHAEMAAASAAC
eukprot:TRINITY_DN158_c0_g1_i9.p1 TRINITY_DN158_c0_g1~~TRINITY_DN158_c0_g1_i9.p1  ORF type:complete len:278 (-),score=37.58 TRINITY_DN158_c0_g1_i9:493-1326(-)